MPCLAVDLFGGLGENQFPPLWASSFTAWKPGAIFTLFTPSLVVVRLSSSHTLSTRSSTDILPLLCGSKETAPSS